MGAPPTLLDLRQQIQGRWTLWEDAERDTWELTQRMPHDAPGRDVEAEFEGEMTDALTRLIGALKARNDNAAA